MPARASLRLSVDLDDSMATEDMAAYAHSLQADVERKQGQGFPGFLLNHGDGSVWVTKVEILLDTQPEQA